MSSQPLFTDRLSASVPTSKDALAQAMAKRFYVDEQGTLVSNGLSTELICFPSDLDSRHEGLLEEKIRNAMSYATAFTDIAELNTLLYLPEKAPSYYLTLGLYLYLADECSRRFRDVEDPEARMTFLTAMRKAGASLKAQQGYDSENLYEKTMEALRELGMEQTHGHIIDDWHRYGNYTIQGVRHDRDGEGNLQGAYAQLARNISRQQEQLGMNLAISYALGNKDHIKNLSSEDAYALTQAVCNNSGEIAGRIREGDTARIDLIKREINKTMQGKRNGISPLQSLLVDAPTQATEILSRLPEQVLEVLYNEGYMCAYANDRNCQKCYPEDDLPGISEDQNKAARLSTGGRQGRYRMMFLSNGSREDQEAFKQDDSLRYTAVAQSLLHETMHVVFRSYLSDGEKKELETAVEQVHEELQSRKGTLPGYMQDRLMTLEENNLAEVIDYLSPLYPNYKKNGDSRREEVICNVMGLMHTEFPHGSGQTRFDPASPHDPYADLPSLRGLADKIAEFTQRAAERSREVYVHSHTDAPGPAAAVGAVCAGV